MKKLLLVALAVALGVLTATAATDYGIQVNGTSVKSDKLSFSVGSGTVSYNVSSNTLTLSSVDFNRSGEAIKVSSNSNRSSNTLKIVFSGTCRAVSTGNDGIVIESNVDFTFNNGTTLGTTKSGKSAIKIKNDATASFYGTYAYIGANDGYAISGDGGDEWAYFKITECQLAGQRGNFYNLDRVCIYPVNTNTVKSTKIVLNPTQSSSYPHVKNVSNWERGTDVSIYLSEEGGSIAETWNLEQSGNGVNTFVISDIRDDPSLTKIGNFLYDTYTYNGETYARIRTATKQFRYSLESTVTIPGYVTLNGTTRHVMVGSDALKGMDMLNTVRLNYGVGYISTGAFRGLWRLSAVYIPSSVKFIGNYFLENSGGSYDTNNLSVYWATLEPGSVSMSDYAFSGCSSSTRTVYMPTRPAITKAKNISKVTSYFTVSSSPSTNACDINNSGDCFVVTTPGSSSVQPQAALVNSENVSVTINTSNIGYDGYLGKYIYCDNVAEQAFMYSTALKYFSCVNSGVTINRDAFAYCDNLISVAVNAQYIKEEAFYDCTALTAIYLNEGVKEIHSRAFLGTPITTLNIPSTLTLFAVTSVSGCKKLEKFTVASGSSYFSTYSSCGALYDKAQTKLIKHPAYNSNTAVGAFPSTLTTINDYAFADNCRTAWIELPYGVTTLGSSSGGHIFEGATSVQSIKIPSSVTYISYTNTFYGCTSLKQLLISTTASRTNATTYTFYNVPSTMRVYVPAHWDPYSSSAPYYTDAVWKDYNVIYGAWDVLVGGLPYFINSDKTTACLERGNNISYGGTDYNLSKSGALVIPSAISYNGKNYTVTGLSRYAFMHNTAITSVEIPAAVNYIGDYAFDGCTGLANIYPKMKDPTSISYGEYIFNSVNKQTCKLTVPAGTLAKYKATYPWSAFYNIVQDGLPGDLNGDGFVNTGDVSYLYQAMLSGSTDLQYDLNGDGFVNTGDISFLYSIMVGG